MQSLNCTKKTGKQCIATLDERVKSYLMNGGLFNPEMMEHDKVRDLIIDLHKELRIKHEDYCCN